MGKHAMQCVRWWHLSGTHFLSEVLGKHYGFDGLLREFLEDASHLHATIC